MELTFPKVSVVISTFNRPDMLREAIESVLAQTFRDFELIVVDDGSETAEAVGRDFADAGKFDGLQYGFYNMDEPSGYQCAPKNVGIQNSRGSYIAYLDDDNLWDEDHLQVLVDTIEDAQTDFVYSRWRYVGEGPMEGKDSPFHQMTQDNIMRLCSGPMHNFIDSSSILHSKAAVVGILGSACWDTDKRRFGDWHLVVSAINRGMTFEGVDKVTFTYRWHGENLQLTRAPSLKSVNVTTNAPIEWTDLESSVAK